MVSGAACVAGRGVAARATRLARICGEPALLQVAHNYEERGHRVRIFTARLDDPGVDGESLLVGG